MVGRILLLIVSLSLGAAAQNSTDDTLSTTTPPLTKVCYDGLDCFENSYPFNNSAGRLPNSPELIGTKILLFNRNTRNGPGEVLSYSDATTIKQSSFNGRLPVKVIIHGFGQDETVEWMHTMKDALLDMANVNVIIVGWGKGAEVPNYVQAAANTRIVGRQIALLLRLLVSEGRSSFQRMHLIAHSLGAHTSGYVGSELEGKLKRISGLDPAEPSFEFKDTVVRLDPSDAEFVDVIHTNAAPIIQGGAGLKQESGHVDFYPNGGEYQPGCPSLISGGIGALLKGNLTEAAAVASCSHNRAILFYIESIKPDGSACTAFPCPGGNVAFSAGRCMSCAPGGCSEMGYNADGFPARGSFYLATDGTPNFCKGPTTAVTLEMTSPSVAGSILLLIKTGETWRKLDFTSSSEKLTGTTTKMLTLPVQMESIEGMNVTYTKYGGLIFGIGAGPQSWSLQKVILESENKRVMFCAPKMVTDGEQLQLIRCKSSL